MTAPTKHSSPAGVAAGQLVLALVGGGLVGALWGSLRPGYEALVKDGAVVVDQAASPASVEFSSYAGFALICAALGVVLSLAAYARSRGEVSLGMLLWVCVAAAAAAFSVHTFGVWVAGLLSDTPGEGHGQLMEGERFHVVPPLYPGVGWLAGPFTAALTYWMLALVSIVSAGSEEEQAPAVPEENAGSAS